MELVPIIYEVLIVVTLLLFVVISISYIVSKIRKAALIEESHDLIKKRSNQITYLHRKPTGNQHHVYLPTRSLQNPGLITSGSRYPNIKVIRRSGVFRNEGKSHDRNTKNIFYPKTVGRNSNNNSKPRFTIINNNGNGNGNWNYNDKGNGTVEGHYSPNRRSANFL